VLLTVVLMLIESVSAVAQTRVSAIDDKVTCDACRFDLGPSISLSESNGAPPLSGPPASIVANRRGQFVAVFGRRDPPAVYDARGTFVTSIGRAGEGPGEFRSAEIIVEGDADTLLIIDRGLQRLTVLSPDFRYVRSAPIPDGTLSGAWTSDGKIVLAAEVYDAARFGKPFHILDRIGNYLSSTGEVDGSFIPGKSPPLSRWICAAAGGGFWSVPVAGEYLIERWSTDGKRLAAFHRRADWFPIEGSPRLGFSRSDPPSPQILSVVEDESGLLWIAIRVPDRNWKSAVRWDERRTGEQAARPIIDERGKAFDVIVEAIDVRNGRLVGRDRLDEAWAVFAGPKTLLTVRDRADGTIDVRIQRVSMRLNGTREP